MFPAQGSFPLPRFQDCFFYSLVFDPVQKTLLADQGEIRVGCKYQAEIPDRLAEGMGRGGKGTASIPLGWRRGSGLSPKRLGRQSCVWGLP